MKKKFVIVALAAVFLQLSAVDTGSPAPAFTNVKDINGKSHNLADYKGKTVVLEWVNYDCPFVKKHYSSNNMQELQRKYTAKGIVWLSVNSSAPGKEGNYSIAEWKQKSAERKVAANAILLDPSGKTGKAYGAKTTPHMYIIDGAGVLQYQGAIDSTRSTDAADIKTSQNYVATALDELAAGKPVSVKETKAYGCSVKY
ncbi:MAG: thioredoxin family protein [Spirochaetes bacterium]|nr:thioredoxin family protein [Spirochaetota bacterium]